MIGRGKRNPQKVILRYHRENKNRFDFPWRKTRDPYRVLVSEVMLQQTQIARVIPYYRRWIRAFPTIRLLARAPFPKVLRFWQGLGYNRRARYLKEAAQEIVVRWNGKIPSGPRRLETLPGIGHYTARAVACFACGRCEPFLDTNIRRVAIHFLLYRSKIGTKTDGEVLGWLRRHQPPRNTREWYYALMDYGREVLGRQKNNPNRRSVRYRKQSKFLGSRRYVRARIVEYLVAHPNGASALAMRRALARAPHCASFPSPRTFMEILMGLMRDGILIQSGARWRIAGR